MHLISKSKISYILSFGNVHRYHYDLPMKTLKPSTTLSENFAFNTKNAQIFSEVSLYLKRISYRQRQGVEPNPNRSFINRFYAIFVEPQPNLNRIFQNRKERTGTEPNNLSTCEP